MAERRGLVRELKRRHVWRVAVAYAVVGWLLVQLASIVLPTFGAPAWALKTIIVLLATGFPAAVVVAWAFEFTPEGIRRTEPAHSPDARKQDEAHSVGRKLNIVIIGVLALAVALLLADRLMQPRDGAGTPAKSIAVLPFENLSDDKDGEYFVVGIQDEILTRLAGFGDLKVVSRTSTEKYRSRAENLREVGRELGVANIVEGSVQRAGDKVRITVQLIDAQTDTHLWAQSYDREMRDVFAVQSDVAGRIATALNLTLQPEEAQALSQVPTSDPVAYDLFLRAEYLANRGGLNLEAEPLRQSLAPYRQAIARDPSFALAFARLSYAQSMLVWLNADGIDADAFTAEARANAERARALNPKLADAFIALGFSDYYGRGRQDFDAALASFATAQRLRPNDAGAMAAAGYVYRRQGRDADAIRKLEEALDHDPRNSRIVSNLAATYMIMWRYADAETAARRALALDPDNMQAKGLLSNAILYRTGDAARALTVLQGDHPYLKSSRAILLWYQRRYAEAIAVVESIPDSPDYFEGQGGYTKATWLGSLYRDLGDTAKAQHYYRLAEGKVRHDLSEAEAGGNAMTLVGARLNLAEVEFGLGRTDEAVRLTDETQVLIDGLDDEYVAIIMSAGNAGLYSSAGRADLAVPLLDRILGSPNGGMAYSPALLPVDPVWDPIRGDPRFVALLEKYPPSSVQQRGAGQLGSSPLER